ncbi:retinal short-chain dehydrogenase/reductase [Meredithblackwellia eburnea MCA 4105]
MEESRLIWDEINYDFIVKVLVLSILHPLFAIWVPITFYSQGYNHNSTPYKASIAYLALTTLLHFLPWLDQLWSDKNWRKHPNPAFTRISTLFGGPTLDWDSEIVLVTGGANGIGQMIVKTLGVMGATVVVLDQVKVDLNQKEFDDVYYFHCDISDEKRLVTTLNQVRQEVGDPTILINNAGVVVGKSLLDLTVEDVRRTFNINTIAQFSLIKHCLPSMLKRGRGHIVTVASILGLSGVAQLADYCASKAACVGLHETLRAELKYRYNDPSIRTTLLLPGHTRTKLFSTISPPPNFLTRFLNPTVQPHEVAKLVINALEKEQGKVIYVPRFGAWVCWLRCAPTWVWDAAVWVSGANEAMRPFVTKKNE